MDFVGPPLVRTDVPIYNGEHVSLVRVEIVIDGVRVIGHVCDRWDAQLKAVSYALPFLGKDDVVP
jgi:hypothetical protein